MAVKAKASEPSAETERATAASGPGPQLDGSVAALLRLQRSAGNAAVARAIRTNTLPGMSGGVLARQAAAPPSPIVSGPGGVPAAPVAPVPAATGDRAQNLNAATAFHNGPVLGPQAIQSSSGIGGFSATYTPASDTLTIQVKAAVNFIDGISDVGGTLVSGDPSLDDVLPRVPPPGPRRTAFLAKFTWAARERKPFLANLSKVVKQAWSGKHEFHVGRPQWEWIGARVRVVASLHPQAATGRVPDDHFSITTLKVPPGRGVGSRVEGDADRTNAFDGQMVIGSNDAGSRSDNLLAPTPLGFAAGSARLTGGARAEITRFAGIFAGAPAGTPGSRPARITIAAREDPRHRGLARNRARAVRTALTNAGVRSITIRITPDGSDDVELIPGNGKAQNVAAHEFGHALGLDDEYGQSFGSTLPDGTPSRPPDGTPVRHNQATQAMTRADGSHLEGAVVENNDNIMSVGTVVKPQHYSTFHEALQAITGIGEWALGRKSKRPRLARARAGTAGSRAGSAPAGRPTARNRRS
jgi:hypothetical protein